MAPSPPSGSVTYKKKDGILALCKDQKSVSWTPKIDSGGPLIIPVANITNLQQTPVTSPKVMLKIFAQPSNNALGDSKPATEAPEQYVFSFTSPTNARAEADAIKETLGIAIQAAKAAQVLVGDSTSAAMAVASAVSVPGKPSWHDDNALRSDAELQQSLLKSDANLQRVFMEALRTRPDSVTSRQLVLQFWSTRIHLLRAHAIEKNQARGSYNVLSSLKPRVEDSVTKLNISKEQIQLIFSQHPLVKRVYDENVPKLTEQQFWSRIFQSRLFKKLRGERITESDPTDPIFDKYLRIDENRERPPDSQTISHLIDLEGNQENHSQRQGNRPDIDMRPTPIEKVPIIRTLNRLSKNIMANVVPVDQKSTNLDSLDEGVFDELRLRDLQGDQEQQRLLLNIRGRNHFFSEARKRDAGTNENSSTIVQQTPEAVLESLRTDLLLNYPNDGVQLSLLVEPEEGNSSDDDDKLRKEHVGSNFGLSSATTQLFGAIRHKKSHVNSESSSTYGLSQDLFDRLTLTHATTTEFLNQFWQAFLSENPERVGDITSLVESLDRAIDRIKAVANEAEAEREAEILKLKQRARDVMASTGKNIRPNFNDVEGGESVVNTLMAPTINALGQAMGEYKRALAQQIKAAGAGS
ncbi:RNA polymerase II transcription factor B subunit 1 [Myotisia sp. PD_48]|nr:RNA polymerase II transcription factor B subunit 1 [Myotisia sp. PD_48]